MTWCAREAPTSPRVLAPSGVSPERVKRSARDPEVSVRREPFLFPRSVRAPTLAGQGRIHMPRSYNAQSLIQLPRLSAAEASVLITRLLTAATTEAKALKGNTL